MICITGGKSVEVLTLRDEMMRLMMVSEKLILDSIHRLDLQTAEKTVIVMNSYKAMFKLLMTVSGAKITDKEGWLKPAKNLASYKFLEGDEYWESFRDQCRWDPEGHVWLTPAYTAEDRLLSAIFDDHCPDCMFWILEDRPCCLCEVKECDPNDCVCSRFVRDADAEDPCDEENADAYYGRQNARHRAYWEKLGSPVYPHEDVPMAKMRIAGGEEKPSRLREKDKESKK